MPPLNEKKISPLLSIIGHSRRVYPTTFLLILVFIFIIPYVAANWDPYEILGVRRDASIIQIKTAYRELAKRLHPDKSNLNEDDAGRRFMELNRAFEILKDPVRRSRFDQHGEIEENRHSRGYHHGHHHPHQNRQTREHWAPGGYRTFTFNSGADGNLRKKSITSKQYYNDYLKESKNRPFFIFFYSDFCPSCDMIEPIWTKIMDELAKYSVRSFTINVYHESRLSHELGVDSIPYISCLLDGQVHPYYLSEISLTTVVKFIKNLLPNNLVPLLQTEYEQDRFISSSLQTNRLTAIILNDEKNLKLRYTLLAYELRHNYRFGHVSRRLSDFALLAKQYNLTGSSLSHILVFDEQIKTPVLHLRIHPDNLDFNNLKKQLMNWPFLKLPRLSSQQKFDDLCLYAIPKDGDKTKTKLCVILFANQTPAHNQARNKMIEFIKMNQLERDDKVVFVYLDSNKQTEFVQSLVSETQDTIPTHAKETLDWSILLIERRPESNRKAHYRWLSSKWDPSRPDELDRSKIELYQYVKSYKQGIFSPENKLLLGLLNDEEAPSLVQRMLSRLTHYAKRVSQFVTSTQAFGGLIALIMCACITSLFLYNPSIYTGLSDQSNIFGASDVSEDLPKQSYGRSNIDTSRSNLINTNMSSISDELKILELKAETYNGMIRLSKPGYRSIVLLADRETKDKLIPIFKKAVWPYRRNKTLLFGYLCLDKNLGWYKSLLEEILGAENLNVNKNKCIGTVLSLNGFKKYLRVYHAKHHEIDHYDDDTDNGGSFLGFDEDGEEGLMNNDDVEVGSQFSKETVYTVDNLLDRLPIWLDKVFDGLTKRYFLDNWPEDMN